MNDFDVLDGCSEFDGLNGYSVFDANDILVGWTDGEEYGFKHKLPVTVSIRMERLARQYEYETIDHKQVRHPLDFSITTGVWRPRMNDMVSGGATVEPLRNLKEVALGFNRETVKQIRSLGEWHLNGMRAGCAHQEPDAGLDSPNCPVTGYRWGSKWLVQPLPDGFLETIQDLFADA